MALATSGPLSLNDIHVEAGGSTGTICSFQDTDIRGLTPADGKTINSTLGTPIDISDFYGASSSVDLTSGGTVNGQAQRQEITASDYISSGGTLVIPSNMWVWSDSTSTAALTIDIPCTIQNNGKIIGKGGAGGYGASAGGGYNSNSGNGGDGGPAIKINSSVSGVTITNASGAFIAGGGGGGGSSNIEPSNTYSGGGGGAGGGAGGAGGGVSFNAGGAGGAINAKGSNAVSGGTTGGEGGDAGGSGIIDGVEDQQSMGGGGGGRILAGSAATGSGVSQNPQFYPDGGGAGNAGEDGFSNTDYFGASGGGGGWGAAGGDGYRAVLGLGGSNGGAGGKAIEDSGNSYTLSNSGTIYGATT
tara:strand:+ start:4154 stop:5230 length:1077 start_codon:yes stop_codon:yes gene_type:complete